MGENEEANAVVQKLQRLPLFRGSKADTLSTLNWCETVDRQSVVNAWTDANAARWAVEAFREKAAEWYRAARVEEAEAVALWTTLRPLVVNRFSTSCLLYTSPSPRDS